MTLYEIWTQPFELVSAFMDKFAKSANVNDAKTSDLLHAAKGRLQVEMWERQMAKRRAGQ